MFSFASKPLVRRVVMRMVAPASASNTLTSGNAIKSLPPRSTRVLYAD